MGRVQRFVARANARLSVQLAATILASSSLLSALLGFLRDRLLNTYYYDTLPNYADAYTVAFIIPDFMFFILVSGALSVTFIPVFNDRMQSGNKKSAWELSTSLVNLLAIVTLIASILIIIFADPLVRYVVGPGLDEVGRGLAVSMMRVIAINPFLFAIASVMASIQQAIGRFTFFALSPVIYNIGIIIGLLFFTGGINIFGVQLFEGGIMGVALGVVLGSIMQLFISAIGLIGLGFDYSFKIHWRNKGFRQVLRLLPARSLDQGIDYFNGIVETNLASRMVYGTVRAYNQATTLHMMPVTLIGVAISTAAFPQMTERLSQGRPDLFRNELQSVLRVIIWLALPIAAIVFFAQDYLVSFLFTKGAPVVATTLGILSIAIVFRSIYHIASRSFYAQKDTKTPLYISLFTISLNIALAIIFTMSLNMGIFGLAWAQSIVAVIEVAILFVIMSYRIPHLFSKEFVRATGRMVLSTLFMSVVTLFALSFFGPVVADEGFYVLFPKFIAIVLVSFVAYLLVGTKLELVEAHQVWEKIRDGVKRIAFGQIRPTPKE
ncbi:MAG TPA: murein biosynthesis integral membrane protein MurJ [Candidatus Saccharibacteria bacterium]|nr:murein biosynthesis integral membrane protein MurJ [Candidatus Saccharibacteria bacterium]